MTIADNARNQAISLEAKKDKLVQLQSNDWKVTFTVQTIDMDPRLTQAAMGTRFAMVLVEIGDDELPVQKEARAASRQVAPSPKPDGTKRDWRDMKPSAQAAIRCGEAIFWAFLNEECGYNVNSKEEAAEAVRDKCGVISRKLLDQDAFQKNRTMWNLLDSGYSAWKALEHA